MNIDVLRAIWDHPYARAGVIVVGGVIAALITNLLVTRVFFKLAAKTKTELDDKILEVLHKPIFWSVALAALGWAISSLNFPRPVPYVVFGILKTVVVIIWASAFSKIGAIFLEWLSERQDRFKAVQPRTMPIFDIAVKAVVIGGAVYALMLAWDINVTGWLASAGILGLAIGFAAKDTLANLFAGVFILADAPYKLGDYVVLGTGERGQVTDIGMRSTRILTRDDIQIVVPNSAIASGKIVNESGGPDPRRRIRIKLSVAYGTDVDQLREVLLAEIQDQDDIVKDPEPRVRFREFGDSGLNFELLGWVTEPALRGRIKDALNTKVYKALAKANIEIPYPKRDVYVHNVKSPGLAPLKPLAQG